jgi:WD40 repeat protein
MQYTPAAAAVGNGAAAAAGGGAGSAGRPAGGGVSRGERRIGCGEAVHAVAAHGTMLFGGLHSGAIVVCDRAEPAPKQTLTGHKRQVNALLWWERWLVSASSDCRLRAWDPVLGRCEAVLEGHGDWVSCAAVTAGGAARLVSGSWDRTLRVWRLGPAPAQWRCERTLTGHEGAVYCAAACGGARVASGSADRSVRVWDAATGAAEATLRGHAGPVTALAADGGRILSAGEDGTVRVWAAQTWAAERVVQVYGPGSGQHVRCLAVSGSKLVGGSFRYRPGRHDAAEVRDLR